MELRLFCSSPTSSCCKCEPPHSTWSSLESVCPLSILDDHREPPMSTTDSFAHHGNHFREDTLENKALDDLWQPLSNTISPSSENENKKCESPDGTLPPDSSSPPYLMEDSLPMNRVLSQLKDTVGPPLLFRHRGASTTRTALNDLDDPTAHITTSIRCSITPVSKPPEPSVNSMGATFHTSNNPSDTINDGSSKSSCDVHLRGFFDVLVTVGKHQDVPTHMADERVVDHIQDICADSRATHTRQGLIRQDIGQEHPLEPHHANADCGTQTPVPPRGSAKILLTAAAIVDSPIPFASVSFHSSSHHDISRDATTSEPKGQDVPSRMFSRRVSVKLLPRLSQPAPNSSLKRRRSTLEDAGCLPPPKKTKLDRKASRNSSDASSLKLNYSAKEPASIRRAQSLRSEVSECSNLSTNSLFSPSFVPTPVGQCRSDKNDSNFPPTAPSTPLPDSVDYARSKANPLSRTIAIHRRSSRSSCKIPTVPIIAPPPYAPPTTIRCAEDCAIDHLKFLLLRERSERERDRLCTYDAKRAERFRAVSTNDIDIPLARSDSSSSSDSSDDFGQWEEETTRSASESLGSQDTTPTPTTFSALYRRANRDTWTHTLGIEDGFRKYITGWMLDVLPAEPQKPHSRYKPPQSNDLFDQLGNSPETPFHAAHILHRYFHIAVGPDSHCAPSQINSESQDDVAEAAEETDELEDDSGARERGGSFMPRKRVNRGEFDWDDWEEGREAVTWDLAIGCLALSVKLHRDVLPPLNPVYAHEFLDLAPHSMSHEDLERSQRDILYALKFSLGSCTPQAVLDELWNALPTLRRAIAPIRDGWTAVQRETWEKLFEAVLEPDMLQYPITLLTAATLIDSLVFSLARQYKSEAEAHGPPACKCHSAPPPQVPERIPLNNINIQPSLSQVYVYEATQLVEAVILDVKDVLQLSDMEFEECRTWLSYVGQE
ncbi:hypothetical protein BS17DRAFT_196099 [Gyrodon lividus]|nr:hypothetical protein BS17DRAFT_196099 [Gyrodon lividus]